MMQCTYDTSTRDEITYVSLFISIGYDVDYLYNNTDD